MLTIKYDGAEYSFDAPLTVYDAVAVAGPVSRENIAAKVNGEVVGMTHVIEADAEVELLTFADADGARVFRHTVGNAFNALDLHGLKAERKHTRGIADGDAGAHVAKIHAEKLALCVFYSFYVHKLIPFRRFCAQRRQDIDHKLR